MSDVDKHIEVADKHMAFMANTPDAADYIEASWLAIEALRAAINAQRTEADALRAENARLTAELAAARAELTGLRNQLATANAVIDTLAMEVASLRIDARAAAAARAELARLKEGDE